MEVSNDRRAGLFLWISSSLRETPDACSAPAHHVHLPWPDPTLVHRYTLIIEQIRWVPNEYW